MKLKNKLILIFIFFVCFVIFNNSDCFATDYTEPPQSHIDYIFSNYINNYTNNFSCYEIIYYYNSSNNKCCYYVWLYNKNDYICFFGPDKYNGYSYALYCYAPNNSNYIARSCEFYGTPADSVLRMQSSHSVNNKNYDSLNYSRYILTIPIYNSVKVISNTTLYYKYFNNLSNVPQDIDNFDDFTIYQEPEPETTKHDLFQLNLTDKNLNNALHTFTLNTDENFVNYSEITDLIENNNKYCIYVTDYTRLLTFSDNSFNATLESGSYLLSGYIDFLVSDNAYFYFSPHYNRIKVCSGDYRGQDMSTYTKRYFFNLVYSDDSDDTYFTILDDNGLLWSLSDYTNDGITSQSEAISDFANIYFIGSNQTIYYAQEDSNYFLDSLTDSIYYGKDRGADERIYNFGFSGGNKKEFYLNEATFNNKVSSENSSIAEKSPVVSQEETFEPVIIYDESNGNSSVIPQDSTTYTYPANTVTDETTSEEDATHRQNERIPYTSTDTNEDTSNWSLWDFIKGIFGKIGNLISSIANLVSDLISGLVNLFIPTAQQWDNLKNDFSVLGDTIQSHLPFVSFIRTTFEDAQNTVVSPFDFLNITMPSFSFYGGNTEQTNYVNVRDAYEPYRIQIRSWLVLIVYGVAFVYIVKYVSDYGATQYANAGLEALQSGNRLGRGKGD